MDGNDIGHPGQQSTGELLRDFRAARLVLTDRFHGALRQWQETGRELGAMRSELIASGVGTEALDPVRFTAKGTEPAVEGSSSPSSATPRAERPKGRPAAPGAMENAYSTDASRNPLVVVALRYMTENGGRALVKSFANYLERRKLYPRNHYKLASVVLTTAAGAGYVKPEAIGVYVITPRGTVAAKGEKP